MEARNMAEKPPNIEEPTTELFMLNITSTGVSWLTWDLTKRRGRDKQ
jgi:hypothetical protein